MTERPIIYDSKLVTDVIPDDLKDTIFETLQAELQPQWSEMSHKGGAVPRLICIQGSVDPETGAQPLYRHPADEQPPLANWSPTVKLLRDIVSDRLNQPINHALIQCYRSGHDYISHHADKTLDIERGSAVVNLSLGSRRTMILRPKKGQPVPDTTTNTPTRVPMDHGSLFVLGWDTNRYMTHEIKRDKRLDQDKTEPEIGTKYGGMRISLTFRTVATFLLPNGGLYGQGAPKEARPVSKEQENEMIRAFSTENRRTDYDWDELYGKGFSVVNFNITNAPVTGNDNSKSPLEEAKDASNESYRKATGKAANPSPKVAVLAIDLQNDFLGDDPSFFLAKRGGPLAKNRDSLFRRIGSLADEVRANEGPVIFIRSIYGEVPAKAKPYPHAKARQDLPFNSKFHSGTHSGKDPCCVRGTAGAELHPDAAAMMQEGDICLEKHYYSSFTETTLQPLLQHLNITHLVICGVTTNNCVAATLRDAFHLGYEILLPPDGCDQVSKKDVIKELEPYCLSVLPVGATICSMLPALDGPSVGIVPKGKLYWDGMERLSGLGAGDSLLIPNFLDEAEAAAILDNLLSEDAEVEWNRLTNVQHGSSLPRLTAYQSDRNEQGHLPAYRCADPQPWHGQYETQPFSGRIQFVKQRIEQAAQHAFNWSRILCYRDGSDGMGFHSDKVLDIQEGTFIASLSLGQAREYELQPKKSANQADLLVSQRMTLRHNTLLLLGPETNRLFLHSVKKKKGKDPLQPRISITFRDLGTWYVGDQENLPAFYGQGTPHASFEEYSKAKSRKGCLGWLGLAGLSSMAFLATSHNRSGKQERPPWLGFAAAGVAAASGSLIYRWKKHRDWVREQGRLSRVYRQCNIQALTPAQAKAMLLHGTDDELAHGTPKERTGACARDS